MTSLPNEAFLKTACRRIFFRDLRLACRLGVYDHEHTTPQTVSLDCDVWVLLQHATSNCDDISDVLDYNRIANILRTAADSHTALQETLVDRLADAVSALPGVVLVRLASAKLEAYNDVAAVGVEVWRCGNTFSESDTPNAL